ncbi:UxaA family hydrolase [Photobacterium sp. OFAV2-7]|uniref:UxaA family hydrolase n=1 Tax=Photobacterium sp. OFAV2-7 TaxID=2917748 RepID=UPI001EF5D8D9|nr:UxaA family hydrolase [Photobacterium sp. OFAV2-7]MCG7587375.1 UxaA family hydrolase [Photobacterium sp. OFAV2-7]
MDTPLNKAILLSQNDNVATLLADVEQGQQIEIIDDGNRAQGIVTCKQAITFGNKVAVNAISTQEAIKKAGYDIGIAIKAIPVGELVHVQNVRSTRVDIPEPIIKQIIEQMQIEE